MAGVEGLNRDPNLEIDLKIRYWSGKEEGPLFAFEILVKLVNIPIVPRAIDKIGI
jgi:hypothetical protein